jgi:hypothetical protein
MSSLPSDIPGTKLPTERERLNQQSRLSPRAAKGVIRKIMAEIDAFRGY